MSGRKPGDVNQNVLCSPDINELTDDIYTAALGSCTSPDFGASRAAVEGPSESEPEAVTPSAPVQRERKLSHTGTPRHKFQLSVASPEFSPSQNPFMSSLTAASPEFRPR